MLKMPVHLTRGLLVSSLSIALTACINMQASQPVQKSNIPQNFSQTSTGTSIAENGYKTFFSDPKLLQVIEISIDNNRDLRTAALNIQRAQQQYQISKMISCPQLEQLVVQFDKSNPLLILITHIRLFKLAWV